MANIAFIIMFLIVALTSPRPAQGHDGSGIQSGIQATNLPGASPSDPIGPIQIQVDAEEADFSEVKRQITELRSEHPSAEIVVSSDIEDFISTAHSENFLVAPIVKKGNFAELVQNFNNGMKNTFRNDKFGVMVITITTASEVLVWLHTSSLSAFERTANVTYALILTAIFGLNKDATYIITKPIKKFISKFYMPETSLQTIFLASLFLNTAVNYLRMPILSLDKMAQTTLLFNSWTVPILMGGLTAVSGFAWNEAIGRIDESTHPVSKFLTRRTIEVRKVILGILASTPVLLNPNTFGLGPWYLMLGSSTIGIALVLNLERITEWFERTFEDSPPLARLKTMVRIPPSTLVRCERVLMF